jgi:peptidoglycan/LPS O-acetylase OafA/YrhL
MPVVPRSQRSPLSGYLPTLDGWRAIAVFAVIAYHDQVHRIGSVTDGWLHSQGFLGVDLFFAISGLLICSRLLEEEAKTGGISLGNFYVRRTFRILPPMLVYLIAIARLGLAHVIQVGWGAWAASLFFVNNYYGAFRRDVLWSMYTNHFWSLGVEEHFYLLLPSLLVFFRNTRARIVGVLAALFFLWNLLHATLVRHDPLRAYADARTDLRLYGLLLPAFLAILLWHPRHREKWVRYLTLYLTPGIVLPTIGFASLLGATVWIPLVYKVIVPFGFPLVILSTVLHPGTWVGRVLEWRPLRALGRISYSIYLWQQLFFVEGHTQAQGALKLAKTGPWNLVATLTLATASYFLVERPLIRLGHRLAPPATPGHRDLGAPAQQEVGAAR